MKVKLLTARSGPDVSQRRGDVVDVGDDDAVRMIEAGEAEVVADTVIETAVPKPTKKTATPAVVIDTTVAKREVETLVAAASGADTVAGGADTVAGGDA